MTIAFLTGCACGLIIGSIIGVISCDKVQARTLEKCGEAE